MVHGIIKDYGTVLIGVEAELRTSSLGQAHVVLKGEIVYFNVLGDCGRYFKSICLIGVSINLLTYNVG